MKKFKILPLVLILLLTLSLLPVTALAVDDPEIGAQAAILADADSGEVYYEKNSNTTIQPASTTKLVTALLVAEAVERGDITLGDEVTATGSSRYNLDEDSTNANPIIEPGEILTVEELLYCAMLVSANEACNILAEYVSGSVSDFVDAMNARVQELGCENTHFANANGLEDPDHYSTAADFAAIAREAITHPTITRICGTLTHTVPATNVTEARTLFNTNSLLDPDSEYYFEDAYGIKTGFFTNAGYCLVSAAERDEINVICVVMGGRELGDQFGDSLTLYRWLFDNFEYRQVLSTTETVVTVPVELGTADSVSVRAEDGVSVILPKDYDATRVGYQYVLYHEANGKTLEAPLNAGEVLGEITVVELDESNHSVRTFGTSRLVAATSVDISRGEYIRSQIKNVFQMPAVRHLITLLIVLLAIYLLLIIFYYVQRIRHMHSMREARRDRAYRQARTDARWLDVPGEPDDEPDEPEEISRGDRREQPVLENARREYPVQRSQQPRPQQPRPQQQRSQQPPRPQPRREEPAPERRPQRSWSADDDFFDSFFQG